eukprot:TRINITY_DN1922_c3_g2_i2.p3 TRINITY_DN1922_c3_g2~~TRINITY_DN1922_c3_g2_i2.p3  ORF type:complete len:326 (+),score=89.64 TRINITY_DN1922_c3_g2_i2:44-979(+)
MASTRRSDCALLALLLLGLPGRAAGQGDDNEAPEEDVVEEPHIAGLCFAPKAAECAVQTAQYCRMETQYANDLRAAAAVDLRLPAAEVVGLSGGRCRYGFGGCPAKECVVDLEVSAAAVNARVLELRVAECRTPAACKSLRDVGFVSAAGELLSGAPPEGDSDGFPWWWVAAGAAALFLAGAVLMFLAKRRGQDDEVSLLDAFNVEESARPPAHEASEPPTPPASVPSGSLAVSRAPSVYTPPVMIPAPAPSSVPASPYKILPHRSAPAVMGGPSFPLAGPPHVNATIHDSPSFPHPQRPQAPGDPLRALI